MVTGATSGIGYATAKALAAINYNLIITGRRSDKLQEVKHELEKVYTCKVLALNFDVREKEVVAKEVESLSKEWKQIDVLVNNAGLAAGLDKIGEGLIDDWDRMVDTNVKGLLYVSRSVIPLMMERNQGHVINISSIAGHEVYDKGNVYCATKHAVEALSKGMRIDLVNHNIKVTSIAPGMAETEFSIVRFHGDENRAKNVYKGFVPLSADDIADAIVYVVTRPAHVCINDMLIMPTAQASATVVNRGM